MERHCDATWALTWACAHNRDPQCTKRGKIADSSVLSSTPAAAATRSTIRRLREIAEV